MGAVDWPAIALGTAGTVDAAKRRVDCRAPLWRLSGHPGVG